MSDSFGLEQSIGTVLGVRPYSLAPSDRRNTLLAILKNALDYGCARSPQFHNYVRHWPVSFRSAGTIADLPYLPVSVFRANPLLTLVPISDIKRILTSSATTGQQPSRVALDAATSRRMAKGVGAIIRDFIGPARRPYLVVDSPEALRRQPELGARGAAIQALLPFSTETACCLRREQSGETALDLETLLACAEQWKRTEALVYGFTYLIWTKLVQPLQRKGISLEMSNVHVLHSGGWKRLEQRAVTKDVFTRGVSSVFGCCTDRVIDYYGMVESVGVVYPDCGFGNKHVPAFAEAIVRNPLTLAPAPPGQPGLLQVCSVLPTSFPGFLLLTEDVAEIAGHDGCPCGRRGTYFRFLRRVPRAELRGCGNVPSPRQFGERMAAAHA